MNGSRIIKITSTHRKMVTVVPVKGTTGGTKFASYLVREKKCSLQRLLGVLVTLQFYLTPLLICFKKALVVIEVNN